jgi:DNA helicase-2/ATP-dependent DNA helicase PcrA
LEEERRLAYVGLTRAKRIAKVSFAQNRRNRGLYQSALPSRFVDELPEAHVEVTEAKMPFGGAYQNFGGTFGRAGYGRSRFEDAEPFEGHYDTPGWQRAQERTREQPKKWNPADQRKKRGPLTIEGELVASSSEQASYKRGERVTHQKFGTGTVTDVDGNKLTIEFDEAGRKRVVDSFVDRA